MKNNSHTPCRNTHTKNTNTCLWNCLSSCWGNVGGKSIPQPFSFSLLPSQHFISLQTYPRSCCTNCVMQLIYAQSCFCWTVVLPPSSSHCCVGYVLGWHNIFTKTSGMLKCFHLGFIEYFCQESGESYLHSKGVRKLPHTNNFFTDWLTHGLRTDESLCALWNSQRKGYLSFADTAFCVLK